VSAGSLTLIRARQASGDDGAHSLEHREAVVLDSLLAGFEDAPGLAEVHGAHGSLATLFAARDPDRPLSSYEESRLPQDAPDGVDVVLVHCSGRPQLQRALEQMREWRPVPLIVLLGDRARAVPFVEAVVADLLEVDPALEYLPVAGVSPVLAGSRVALLTTPETRTRAGAILTRLAAQHESSFDPLLVVEREHELVRAASRELADVRARLTREQKRLSAMERSFSWRLTAPLRRLARRRSRSTR